MRGCLVEYCPNFARKFPVILTNNCHYTGTINWPPLLANQQTMKDMLLTSAIGFSLLAATEFSTIAVPGIQSRQGTHPNAFLNTIAKNQSSSNTQISTFANAGKSNDPQQNRHLPSISILIQQLGTLHAQQKATQLQ
jgi:hypothetical protein